MEDIPRNSPFGVLCYYNKVPESGKNLSNTIELLTGLKAKYNIKGPENVIFFTKYNCLPKCRDGVVNGTNWISRTLF